jgi:hypothetical protein
MERIFFLGYSQGGSMALDLGLFAGRFGGVISISGLLEPFLYDNVHPIYATPILVTVGQTEPTTKDVLSKISCHGTCIVIPGKGQTMPKDKFEMNHIMEFFAKHLWLRNLKLEAMSDVYLVG